MIKNKNEALNLTFSLNSRRINIFLDLIYIKMGKTSDETVIQNDKLNVKKICRWCAVVFSSNFEGPIN